MKSITVAKRADGPALMTELFAALPALRPAKVNGENFPRCGVSAGAESVTVEFPDDVDEAAVRAAVSAHVPPVPRRQKGLAALLTEIQSLTTADRNKLLAAMAAEFLRERPAFARKLGINLDGDEPSP
jgi:hypothetical protein